MKYIDAEKLKADIERRMTENCKLAEIAGGTFDQRAVEDNDILALIDSLQQEQPESSKGKFVFPNFLYARTVDNKTIDVSYAPQSLDAVEYIKNDPTEQPEVNLDNHTIMEEIRKCGCNPNEFDVARHFYELGLNARKEDER